MQIAQIDGFLEIVRRGNLSRAAEALFITQPALTARLQALEEELGSRLFVRGRGMELTEEGEAFRAYAERAVDALRDGARHVADIAGGAAGELAVGAAPGVGAHVLPPLLARFRAAHPRVRLIVRTGHSEEIVEMLLRGEIRIGLVRELRHPGLEIRPLYADQLVLVADPAHPFANRRSIPVARIADAELILFDRTSSYYDLTNALFREAGVAPRGQIELDNIDAAKGMVLAGLGVALLPLTAVAADLVAGSLRAVEIEDAPAIRRTIVSIRRADIGPATGATAAFMTVLAGIDRFLPESIRGR
jgi:DNA-binding transcriptional LysR family regulator